METSHFAGSSNVSAVGMTEELNSEQTIRSDGQNPVSNCLTRINMDVDEYQTEQNSQY